MNAVSQKTLKAKLESHELGRIPSRFYYRMVHYGTALLCRILVNPRIHRDPRLTGLEGPLVILSNHPSYVDPPLVAMVFRDRWINFLTTQVFFRKKMIGHVLFKVGAIPKVQFRSDSRAVKAMLRVLSRAGTLGIFPEGQRSLDGTPTPFDDAIVKLIRKSKCAVAIVHISGAYLTWPRWSTSGFRRGRIDVRSELLLTRNESAVLTVNEIHERIIKSMDYQEFDWQRQEKVRFHSTRPAESLHWILHQCPGCGSTLAMRSRQDRLTCRHCGNAAVMDRFGFLHASQPEHQIFEDIRAWHLWQIDQQYGAVGKDGFSAAYPVELLTAEGEQPYVPFGSGVLTLSESGFDYAGSFGGQPVDRHFPLPGRGGLNADYGSGIELADADTSYRFLLDDGQKVILIADQLVALLDKKQRTQE